MPRCKVLALIDKDPELKEICGRIEEREKQLKQKVEFIEKQLKNAFEEMKSSNEPDWELITSRLKETGAFEGYNKDTHHLSFSISTNAIELCENYDDHPFRKLLGRIL